MYIWNMFHAVCLLRMLNKSLRYKYWKVVLLLKNLRIKLTKKIFKNFLSCDFSFFQTLGYCAYKSNARTMFNRSVNSPIVQINRNSFRRRHTSGQLQSQTMQDNRKRPVQSNVYQSLLYDYNMHDGLLRSKCLNAGWEFLMSL